MIWQKFEAPLLGVTTLRHNVIFLGLSRQAGAFCENLKCPALHGNNDVERAQMLSSHRLSHSPSETQDLRNLPLHVGIAPRVFLEPSVELVGPFLWTGGKIFQSTTGEPFALPNSSRGRDFVWYTV